MSLVDLGKRLLESSKAGDTEDVRALMTNGAPFTTDWLGTSPLHMAAQFGHVETAEVLLRGGISRDARTKVERTPLHIAAQEGYLDIVKLLINHGAEIDARDMLKMTPLHWAVDRNHYHVVVYLLKNNADVHALSKFDKKPIDIAMENRCLEIIEVLHKQATNPAPPPTKAKIIQLSNANSVPQTFKTTVPLILKTESLSPAVQKTLAQTLHAATPVVTSVTSLSPDLANSLLEKALKTPTVTKPMVLRSNLTNFQKPSAASSTFQSSSTSSDSEDGESSEQGDSNVLTTLAALAEATAVNSSLSNADAMKWLEKHGITMLPTDNSTIMASALEGGQTVALTEAGKLALTWVKEHQNLNNNSINPPTTQKNVPTIVTSSQNSIPNQKVITIVGDKAHMPSIVSAPQPPLVVFSNPAIQTTDMPPLKKFKTVQVKLENSKEISNDSTVTSTSSETNENLKLKEELERLKKQAELYKAQLVIKEHEAEEYKKQLEQMKTVPNMDP